MDGFGTHIADPRERIPVAIGIPGRMHPDVEIEMADAVLDRTQHGRQP